MCLTLVSNVNLATDQNARSSYMKNGIFMKLSIYYNARQNHLSLDTQRDTYIVVHDWGESADIMTTVYRAIRYNNR